ncbi:MAG: rhomboid family intramembrane serine protease [Chloroflexota bacterium]
MELNPILLLIVGFSIVITLWRAIFVLSSRYFRGLIVACLLVLALMGVMLVIQPDQAGTVSLIAWVIFLVIPAQGRRLVEVLVARGRYAQAIRLAKVIRILHPADGYIELPDIVQSQAFERKGDTNGAIAILKKYESHPVLGIYANTHIMRLQMRYADLLNWIETQATPSEMKRDPALVENYLAALGQTGQLSRMIHEFQRLHTTLNRSRAYLNLGYLRLFASTGQREPVEQLLNGPFRYLAPPARQTWIALTDMSAGKIETGKNVLRDMGSVQDDIVQRSAAYWLQNSPAVASQVLSAEDLALLDSIRQEFDQYHAYERSAALVNNRRAYATWVIIALNVAMFLLEIQQGGSENLETLYKLGALWPPGVLIGGEWWRVIAAMFLHLGLAHIALNMLALYILGPFLERMVGTIRYILIYALAGLGSMGTILALTQAGVLEPDLLVGASGAIMGLVGATAALYLHDWRVKRSQIARSRLLRPLFIVVTQFGVDLLIPQTSLVGHLSGAIFGFIAALIVLRFTRPKLALASQKSAPQAQPQDA